MMSLTMPQQLPTYGTYSNQYSVDKKTIIALNSFSPTYELQEARKPAAEENLPRVSAWVSEVEVSLYIS